MPWQLARRDNEWCVVKVGESEPVPGGCHATRGDAIKHQRALYANEARTASLYERLDALPAEQIPEPVRQQAAQEIRLVLGDQNAELNERMVRTLDALVARLETGDRVTEAMVAAVRSDLERPAPVVNVAAPNVTIEPTPVNVAAPQITVESPQVHVAAPEVMVRPEIVLPSERKKVEFERDRAGRITGANVVEEVE